MYCGVMFSFKTKPNLEITITVSIGNTCIVSILLRYIKYYYNYKICNYLL